MMKNSEEYVASVLYKYSIKEEKAWRKNGANAHDVAIADELLQEVRALGYRYKFLTDITHRDHSDMELLNILLRYIGRFKDEWISAELIRVVGIKGNMSATETIIKNYMESTEEHKQRNAGFYDWALSRIKDKRYMSDYLEFLKNPQDAKRMSHTMIMLGKWHVPEAKPYFLQYLKDSSETDQKIDNRVYNSMEALSYYVDEDGVITKEIEKMQKSNNKDLVHAAKKAIKRLEKNKKS